ncbi:MAG: type II toxin-antitoxin system prevent-host-death family antitoxin [Desulfobacteraceae bacterium]|jgi:prevent-host-death family protein
MDTVGAYEAKTHLPKLLDRVAKGEQIIITRHGSPVAILRPVDKKNQIDVADVIQKMRRLRKKHRLNGLNIKEMIEQGRK